MLDAITKALAVNSPAKTVPDTVVAASVQVNGGIRILVSPVT